MDTNETRDNNPTHTALSGGLCLQIERQLLVSTRGLKPSMHSITPLMNLKRSSARCLPLFLFIITFLVLECCNDPVHRSQVVQRLFKIFPVLIPSPCVNCSRFSCYRFVYFILKCGIFFHWKMFLNF